MPVTKLDDDHNIGKSSGQVHILEDKRTIIMEGILSEQLAIPVIRAMHDFSYHPAPVNFWIYSYGGDLDATYAIYDTMQLLNDNNSPVTTVGFGNIASAATVLVLGGRTRLALENSNFMVHSIEYEFSGAPSAGKSYHNLVNKTQERYFNLLGKNSLKPKEFWKKQIKENKEYWFGSKEAKLYGLIHRILDSREYSKMLKAYNDANQD